MSRRIRPAGAHEWWDDPAGRRQALQEARIPERYWSANLQETFLRAPAMSEWVRLVTGHYGDTPAWLADGYGFYLHGPLGVGKSSVAALLAMAAIERAERVLWLPVRDVPGVRFHTTPTDAELDARLPHTDVLVLDDLGAEGFKLEGPAGAALEAVVRIIYDRGRSLLVTSNISWDGFKMTYPAALVSVTERCTKPVPWKAR